VKILLEEFVLVDHAYVIKFTKDLIVLKKSAWMIALVMENVTVKNDVNVMLGNFNIV
jgi:hypothetical protein